ncbi:MAG: P-loop NTPase [Desulfatiglandaceae bacterium]
MKISVCGKGGSGKSTVVTLLANLTRQRGFKVLVVDSDESNSGLFRMLGFEKPPIPLMEMVGGKSALKKNMQQPSIFEQPEIEIDDIPSSYIERKDGLSLVSIGKILQSLEGCACPMGVLSREFLKKLRSGNEMVTFVDMEAGVEHFGRGIDEGIDRVIIVVEPSYESLRVAEKIKELAGGMGKAVDAVLNKVPSDQVAEKLDKELNGMNIDILGKIPNDPMVFDAGFDGGVINRGEAFDAVGKVLDAFLPSK